MKDSVLRDKSYAFAVRIVRMYQYLSKEKKEFVLSKQILRCGTSVGANIAEAGFAQSKADFIAKLSVAIKEANETHYWLNLLRDTDYLDIPLFQSLEENIVEIRKLLTASLKTAKTNQS